MYKNTGSYGGMYIETQNVGQPFYGYSAGGDIDAFHYFDGSTGNWHLSNSGGVRVTVAEDGNVGIGTTTPSFARLKVETTDTSAIWGIVETTSNSNFGVYGEHTGSGRGVYGRASAVLGIGVDGFAAANSGFNIGVRGKSNSTAGYDFYADGAGINYGAASSRRWKNNVRVIENPLDKISQIRGVYFDWDAENGGHHDVGLIAEEVGRVLPEIVTYEENGIDALGMDYSKLTPLLVEAVKAMRAENFSAIKVLRAEKNSDIASLKAVNDALRVENKDLHTRLNSLEQLVLKLASTRADPTK